MPLCDRKQPLAWFQGVNSARFQWPLIGHAPLRLQNWNEDTGPQMFWFQWPLIGHAPLRL